MNGIGNKPVRTFIVSFSDLHFGEKEFYDDGRRNPITDFLFDQELVDLLRKVDRRAQDQSAERKCLVLNGDVNDTQTVAMLGEYTDYPLEEVAVYKTKEIIRMHPEIFDCLKDLIDHGWVIYFNIGNHDVCVSWDGVQKLWRERIAPDHPERLVFGDDCEIERFYFRHLYEIEPHNTVAPLLERFRNGALVTVGGKKTPLWIPEPLVPKLEKKKRYKNLRQCTIINAPIGNYMTIEWTNRLKQAGDPNKDGPHRWVGRMYTHAPIWRHSFFHDLGFGIRAGFVWAKGWTKLLFGTLFDVRKKVGFWQLYWQLLTASLFYVNSDLSEAQTVLAFEILKNNPNLRAVVAGHTHKAGRWTSDVGTVYNTGTWIGKYEIESRPQGFWQRLKYWLAPIQPVFKPWLTFFMAECYNDEASANIYEYDRKTKEYKEVI